MPNALPGTSAPNSNALSSSHQSGTPPKWHVTPLGRAVYASSLPAATALRIHARLEVAMELLVLGDPLHLLFCLIDEHPFCIVSWPEWA